MPPGCGRTSIGDGIEAYALSWQYCMCMEFHLPRGKSIGKSEEDGDKMRGLAIKLVTIYEPNLDLRQRGSFECGRSTLDRM